MDNAQLKSLVAGKYGLARSTISTWFLPENKVDIIAAFLSETINLKRKNVKAGKYADLNKAFFLFSSGLCLQGQVTYQCVDWLFKRKQMIWHKKNLEIANFKASNGWVDRWEARNNVKFKTVSCLKKSCKENRAGRKHFVFQPYCQVMDWRISLMVMSLVFSFTHYQSKL